MAVPVPKGPGFGRTRRTRRTLVLSVVFVLYLVVGGTAFHFLETYSKTVTTVRPLASWRPLLDYLQSNSSERRAASRWREVKQAAVSVCHADGRQHVAEVLESLHTPAPETGQGRLAEDEDEGALSPLRPPAAGGTLSELLLLCGNSSYQLLSAQQEVPWSFIDALFFCMTVVTTIGYGHISPSTPGGQIFCIVYSLLGIPISGLLLAGLSDIFAGNLLNFYETKWMKRHGDSKWSLAAFTSLYLLVGFLMFVFVPAIFFSWLEDWNYREAVYYAFITLSTIGFGDYTAAISEDSPWGTVYKLLVMVWILVGLSYWVLVLNFLQKSLKSKEVLKTLKSTSRLIAKEADELCAALAEVGLIHRDATFIPEHSKMALSMMLSMSRSLAGTSPSGGDGEGAADPPDELRGIHSIGNNLRSHGLLAALMASLPTPTSPPQTSTSTTPPSATTAPGAGEELDGRVNEGYLSDDTSDQVSSPISASSARLQAEAEAEIQTETEGERLALTARGSDGARREGERSAEASSLSPDCAV